MESNGRGILFLWASRATQNSDGRRARHTPHSALSSMLPAGTLWRLARMEIRRIDRPPAGYIDCSAPEPTLPTNGAKSGSPALTRRQQRIFGWWDRLWGQPKLRMSSSAEIVGSGDALEFDAVSVRKGTL